MYFLDSQYVICFHLSFILLPLNEIIINLILLLVILVFLSSYNDFIKISVSFLRIYITLSFNVQNKYRVFKC